MSQRKLRRAIKRETREIERREAFYREGRPPVEISGRTVILVDDGLVTGASMRASIHSVKRRARAVIVAAPVGAKSTCEELAHEVNAVVCALVPEPLDAVSLFYREFGPTTDEEVKYLIDQGMR